MCPLFPIAGIVADRPVCRIQRRGGQGPSFRRRGGGQGSQISKFPLNHKGPPYVKTGPQISGGGHGPPCIRAWLRSRLTPWKLSRIQCFTMLLADKGVTSIWFRGRGKGPRSSEKSQIFLSPKWGGGRPLLAPLLPPFLEESNGVSWNSSDRGWVPTSESWQVWHPLRSQMRPRT